MTQTLVIVESPAKAKTITKFLGKNYKVEASMGHVRDLPKSQMGVDIDNNYEPKYITIRGKGKIIENIKKQAKKSDKILLATDPDREGEAISWHLANILGIDKSKTCRIEFHEITKDAVKNSIKNPRPIDNNLFCAQQARRVLDRLVGYQISPILWRKIKWGLSAGRVQSVAVKLICDREDEIEKFVPEEYWTITAKLSKQKSSKSFDAKFYGNINGKIQINNADSADKIASEVENGEFIVQKIKKGEKKRNPAPPFTTSTLQQEAYKRLGFSTKKTMVLAQQLYEGIDIAGEGSVGLITYMRTDSTKISNEAQEKTRKLIVEKYGEEYVPSSPRQFKSKKGAQEAHEAIRPTSSTREPGIIKGSLKGDQYKLYKLIYDRFIASQMSQAVMNTVSVDIINNGYIFKSGGSNIKFPGFMAVYSSSDNEEDQNIKMPELCENESLKTKKIEHDQHFTQPPSRFTEASLVKTLEENGIGRPSTYSPIISTIIDREYVERENKTLKPTELGTIVNDIISEYFNTIVDVEFTANMEDRLDQIEEGKIEWVTVVDEFYKSFAPALENAEKEIGKITIEEEPEITDIKCELCGRYMVIKKGRYGKFLACPGYPECKNTKPILEKLDVACPKCGSNVVVRRTKKGRKFLGCSTYPSCNFMSWNEPTNKRCIKCGSVMEKKYLKGGSYKLVCANKDCKYEEKLETKNPDGDKNE
jgi:DNA topoisomerase-1